MDHPEQLPAPSAPDCLRTRFLEVLLHDQERGRIAAVEDYLGRFPAIADFVRTEHLAFSAEDAPLATTEPALPEDCGRYRLTRRLGEGGMGVVHEAIDADLGRRVVVKTLQPDFSANAQARERLRREARVLGRLEHANLTKVIDLIEANGRMHLVMPFHDGRPLAQHIQDARTRSEPAMKGIVGWPVLGPDRGDRGAALRQIVAFFVACARALHSAHGAGVVHRDLKPQNLMVGADGSPVVLDFGLALPEGDGRLTIAGELMGTPLYMAPEQVEGQAADARTDVYGLGVSLYETLTLVHPFAGPGGRDAVFQRILAGDPVPLRRHQPLLARDLEAVVLRAIDRQPRRRYQDMDAFARDLQRVLDLEPTEARPVSRFDLAWRKVRRRPLVSVLVVVTGAALGLAAWNQVRVNDMKDFAQDILGITREDGPPAGKFVRIADKAEASKNRSLSQKEWIQALHPRGLVASAARFAWAGSGTRDADWPNIRFRFTYRVEVLDGTAEVASWSCQSSDAPLCSCAPPVALTLVSERTYHWRVQLEHYEAIGEPGHDPERLAQCAAITLDDLQKRMPPITTAFRVAATPPAALRPEFGTVEARVQSLIGEQFAADALALLEADAASATSSLSIQRHNELVAAARGELDREAQRR